MSKLSVCCLIASTSLQPYLLQIGTKKQHATVCMRLDLLTWTEETVERLALAASFSDIRFNSAGHSAPVLISHGKRLLVMPTDMTCLQDIAPLLAVVGKKLSRLEVHGPTGLLDAFKFTYLYTVPNLQTLIIKDIQHRLDHEDVERGLATLRWPQSSFIVNSHSQAAA